MIRIAIIEDEPLISKFHQKYIEKIDGFCCVGSVETIEEGIRLARQPDIDLILLDVYLQQKKWAGFIKANPLGRNKCRCYFNHLRQ